MNRPQRNSSQGIAFPFQDAFKYFMIDPTTNWQRFYNPQFYINCNTGDVDVENAVLREVGSYGMQLGRILDVIDVLVATVKGPKEKDTTLSDVDRLISGLQSLERSDPAAYRLLVDRLQNAIGANDKA